MAIKKTEAFVLKAFNWSESSRTISFFTRDRGKLPLTDRGGRSIKSKRGRALPFAHLAITYYDSERASAGHLSDVSVVSAWTFEGESVLGRLAFASAACELLWQTLPDEESHPEIFHYTLDYFSRLDSCPRESLPGLFLSYFIRTLSFLGYRPVLTGCVGCGKGVREFGMATARFSADRGGLLCGACQVSGERYIALSETELALSIQLQAGSLAEAAKTQIGFAEMNRIAQALIQFLGSQTGMLKMKSLEFLDKLKVADFG
ncbi:DNA repair protein RecO [Gemmatimonas aurantiaca]|nr:DNA repair protein RecO [Gemmatimonas aurantiaca]